MAQSWNKRGLSDVGLDDLKKMLRLTHREELRFPLTVEELTRTGLQHLSGRVDVLRGLDARGVRAVLVAVIAERTASS